MDLHEVDGQTEVLGRKVREPVGGGLVPDAEHVPQVLHRELPLPLGLGEHRHRRTLGQEDRRSEIVRIHALLEELAEVLRRPMAEHVRGETREQMRARIEGGIGIGQVDPPVRGIGDRPGRGRQIGDVVEAEAELLRDRRRLPLGHRPRLVAGEREQLGRLLLEIGEVVVLLPHRLPQLPIGPPGLLRGRRPPGEHLGELPLQADDRLERILRQGLDAHLRQTERGVHRGGLIPLSLEFESLPAVDRRGVEELGDLGAERLRDARKQRDRSFPLAVLDRRDLRGRTPHSLPELGQRQTRLFAKKSDSSADAEVVDGRTRFRLRCLSTGHNGLRGGDRGGAGRV